jgi:hypothetical protein
MRKLLTLWIALAAIVCTGWANVEPAHATCISLTGAGKVCGAPSGGGAAFTFQGSGSNGNNSATRTFSIDIGTASADRLVVVAVGSQSGPPSGITAAGVSLTQDVVATNSQSVAIYSALVTSGSGAQNVVVSGVSAFNEVGVAVWVGTGLSSNTVKQTGFVQTGSNSAASINVTAGDFVVAITGGSGGNSSFSGSTEAATVRNVDTTGPFFTSAEWLPAASTNGSFAASPTTGSTFGTAAASYR